jgi:D-alanyl-lipoteichoic acid acyltransferase DltB (MBOAT superfamily)
MIFNSYQFLFLFLPISLIIFFILQHFKKEFSIYFIIIISIIFYIETSYENFFLLLGALLLNFYSIKIVKKFFFLVLLIFLNLFILVYYKYFKFFIDPTYSKIPLGISFYIFNQIVFLIDCYNLRVNKPEFKKLFFLVLFFPHLIAGPFLRYLPIISQLKNKSFFQPSAEKFLFGLIIFSVGLCKKIIFADTLGIYVDNFHFNLELNSPKIGFFVSWISSLAYTLQLYFDFSGYSDMAIGLGMFFGIILPINFNSPYLSTSVVEFWKRWHITLGKYIFEFIYIPLSLFLKKKISANSKFAYNFIIPFISLMLTFLIVGLWHGSGKNISSIWNFLIFGGLHGFFSYLNHIFRDINILKKFTNLKKCISVFLTFNIVNFAFIFFRSSNVANAYKIIEGMLGFNGYGLHPKFYNYLCCINLNDLEVWNYSYDIDFAIFIIYIFISLFIIFFTPNINQFSESSVFRKKLLKNKISLYLVIVFSCILFASSILLISKQSGFLYFNF